MNERASVRSRFKGIRGKSAGGSIICRFVRARSVQSHMCHSTDNSMHFDLAFSKIAFTFTHHTIT